VTREQILAEILVVKHRIMSGLLGPASQQAALVALIALYDCIVAMDNEAMKDASATTWERPIRRYTAEERKAA
jgi:hypothetical protein